MKILYNNQTGKIYYTVKDQDYYWFTHTTNIPLEVFELEETELNKTLCIDVFRRRNKTDKAGDQKYSIQAGKIEEKENWIEKVVDINEEKYLLFQY